MDDNDKKSQDIFEKMRWLDSLQPLKNIIPTAIHSASALMNIQKVNNFSSPAVHSALEFHNRYGLDLAAGQNTGFIDSYMKGIADHPSDLALMASVTSATSLVESFRKVAGYYDSALASVTSAKSFAESIRKAAKYDSALVSVASASSLAESFRNVAGYDSALASVTSASSVADSFRKTARFDSALAAVTSAASFTDLINDSISASVMDSIRHQPSLIEGLNTASNSFLLLKDMLQIADYGLLYNDREDLDVINDPVSEYKVESIVDSLSDVSESKRFIDFFKGLNPNIQAIIIYMVLSFFESQINNVISYHMNMGLDHIYSNDALSTKEKVHKTKSIVWGIDDAQLSNFRFITGDNVRLREDSSTKSAILDELALGQVVEVHSKKKNWVEVSYQYEDGTYMNGWVFTRYTARLVK